jgi:hypothetical protein
MQVNAPDHAAHMNDNAGQRAGVMDVSTACERCMVLKEICG